MSKTPPAKPTKKAPEFPSMQQTHRGDANTRGPHEYVAKGGRYVPTTYGAERDSRIPTS